MLVPVAAKAPILVAPKVSAGKLERELNQWDANADTYRSRGWIIVARQELAVDVAFTCSLALAGRTLTAVAATVRFDFANYDLWPPSVSFIDLTTGQVGPTSVRAVMQTDQGPRDLLVEAHPETGHAFLCVPGTREYHQHPQHSGDDWLLHRGTGEGRLATLCDLIWRTMAQNVLGLRVVVQAFPPGLPPQMEFGLAQGEVQMPQQVAGALNLGNPALVQ